MRSRSYHNFSGRIHGIAKKQRFPLRVMFELTYRCNFKCKHCYIPESYKKNILPELRTREVFFILDQLADIGCFYLGFTGGEPFLRTDIFNILRYAKKKGFQIIIYTNGSLIKRQESQELRRINPNKVDITIPAWQKNVFEKISGSEGSRDRVFTAIRLLREEGLRLGFKTCVLKENVSDIGNIRSFARSVGAQHRLDDILFPRLDGSTQPFEYRGTLGNHKDKLAACDLSLGKPIRRRTVWRKEFFTCGAGISQAAITPYGELKMCLMIEKPRFRILKKDVKLPGDKSQAPREKCLKEAWGKLKKFACSIKPDENYKCDRCELRNYCKWCPARSRLYDGTFTSCDPVSRRSAESLGMRQ